MKYRIAGHAFVTGSCFMATAIAAGQSLWNFALLNFILMILNAIIGFTLLRISSIEEEAGNHQLPINKTNKT